MLTHDASVCLLVSRYGRVNYVLARRLELLKEVGRLQESLDVPGDVSYTCETAGHFYLYQVPSCSLCVSLFALCSSAYSVQPLNALQMHLHPDIDLLKARTFLFVDCFIKMEYVWLAAVPKAFMAGKSRESWGFPARLFLSGNNIFVLCCISVHTNTYSCYSPCSKKTICQLSTLHG